MVSLGRGSAQGHLEVRRRIDRLAGQDHLEIDMRAGNHPGPADNPELLAGGDCPFSTGERRCDHAQMAVDAHEAIVLHEYFEAAGTLPSGYGSPGPTRLPIPEPRLVRGYQRRSDRSPRMDGPAAP